MSHEELKSKIDQLRRKADRASGALAEHMKQLKKEFGCDSLKAAEKLLEKLEQEQEQQFTELEKALEKFEKEYKDDLAN